MTLSENPIFLTQKRLVHRAGALAAVIIAALIGLSFLAALIASLANPRTFDFRSPQAAGKVFYGWVFGLETLVLIAGGFIRISRALADDRKSGLWDSNRLTPLKPPQLVIGYWLGAALREFYMASVLAILGLVIVVIGRLPLTLWFGTQILLAGAALFFGLLAVLTGLGFERPKSGIAILAALVFLQAFSLFQPRLMITNFLLPVYGVANLFHDPQEPPGSNWSGYPEVFGLPVHPVLFSLGLQAAVGFFLWRATVRKTANPFQPLLQRREAVAMFGVSCVVQHGLMWGLWQGRHGAAVFPGLPDSSSNEPLLPIVHCGTVLVGTLVLAFASPQPERVRLEALRTGRGNVRLVFSRSAMSLALAITAAAGASLLSQYAFSLARHWKSFVVAFGNLLDCFLIFSLLLEFCRMRFQRCAWGFVALGLFILCALPFVLAGIFSNEGFGRLSLLSPGVAALNDPNDDELNRLMLAVLAHSAIVVFWFVAWWNQWRRLFASACPGPGKSARRSDFCG
jgi:hypothetical protein